ncbi:MAG: hypothetical protein ABIV47_13020 [Roseiflexaceae bacterium]
MIPSAGSTGRIAFVIIAAGALLVGAGMFFFPYSLATLPAPVAIERPWPWPIGPLAVRFVGSALIAIALSAGLIVLRPDLPSILAYATLMMITGGWLLLHILLNRDRIDWARPLAFVWVLSVAAIWLLGTVAVLRLRPGTPYSVPPLPTTPPLASRIALVIALLTGVVGITMFFFPAVGRARWPWDLGDQVNVQLLGGLFLSISTISFWSWRQPSWYGYDLLFPGAGTFATVALIAALLHWNLFAAHPVTSPIFVVVYMLGALLGFYPYIRYSLRKYMVG